MREVDRQQEHQTKEPRRIFSYEDFEPRALLELKRQRGVSISVAIPTLNEEQTIGGVIDVIHENLRESVPLVDEIVVVDSDSTDRTEQEVRARGIPFFRSSEVLDDSLPPAKGKGENLWKSLLVTRGDIVVWTDADALNPDPAHVYGLVGPLLLDADVRFVKAFFLRYTQFRAEEPPEPNGGRVTELVARPMLNLLFPEISHIYQPYNGNVAGRREVLESLEFPAGYGADVTVLIDVAMRYGPESIAQVYCKSFKQEGQDLQGLGRMSFQALRATLRKAQEYGRIEVPGHLPTALRQLTVNEDRDFQWEERELAEQVRPPLATLKQQPV